LKNRNPKMVEILDERDLVFKCKICGQVWLPGSKLNLKSWQCPKGCKAKDLKE